MLGLNGSAVLRYYIKYRFEFVLKTPPWNFFYIKSQIKIITFCKRHRPSETKKITSQSFYKNLSFFIPVSEFLYSSRVGQVQRVSQCYFQVVRHKLAVSQGFSNILSKTIAHFLLNSNHQSTLNAVHFHLMAQLYQIGVSTICYSLFISSYHLPAVLSDGRFSKVFLLWPKPGFCDVSRPVTYRIGS